MASRRRRHPLQHGRHSASVGRRLGIHRAQALHSHSVALVRKEYCASRAETDRLGKKLGKLAGIKQHRSKHKKRHTTCRSSR